MISLVYGSTNKRVCADLWNSLASLNGSLFPWILLGDLNTTLCSHDKLGGRPFTSPRVSRALQHLVSVQGFEDLGFSDPYFTWCNGQAPHRLIWSRIDRAFGNARFLDLFPICRVRHLARTGSDHSPIFLFPEQLQSLRTLSRPRKFEHFWLDLPGLPEIVSQGLSVQCSRGNSDFLDALPARLTAIFDMSKAHGRSSLDHLETALDQVERQIASLERRDASGGPYIPSMQPCFANLLLSGLAKRELTGLSMAT